MADADGDGPITFEDLGIRQRDATQDTMLGKSRTWADLEKVEVAFLAVSVLSILATIGMTIYKLATGLQAQDFTFAILILFNTAFCLFYVFHGMFRERPYELFVFVSACTIIILYVILNFVETEGWHNQPVKLARLIVVCFLVPINIFLALLVSIQYYKSGNLIFRTVGASVDLQHACKKLFTFEAFLKFDLQLEGSMIILVLRSGQKVDDLEIVALVVGLLLGIAWAVLGYIATRQENKLLTYIFFGSSVLEPAYIIYKIVKAGMDISAAASDTVADALPTVTVACAVLALIVRILVVVWAFRVYQNYGLGLKEKVYAQTEEATPTVTGDIQEEQP